MLSFDDSRTVEHIKLKAMIITIISSDIKLKYYVS